MREPSCSQKYGPLPWCCMLLMWCPLHGSCTNLCFPYRGAPSPIDIAVPLHEWSWRSDLFWQLKLTPHSCNHEWMPKFRMMTFLKHNKVAKGMLTQNQSYPSPNSLFSHKGFQTWKPIKVTFNVKIEALKSWIWLVP